MFLHLTHKLRTEGVGTGVISRGAQGSGTRFLQLLFLLEGGGVLPPKSFSFTHASQSVLT